jgi:hypothetical protein
MNTSLNNLPVAVISAGPAGLAAAAHLTQNGYPPIATSLWDELLVIAQTTYFQSPCVFWVLNKFASTERTKGYK